MAGDSSPMTYLQTASIRDLIQKAERQAYDNGEKMKLRMFLATPTTRKRASELMEGEEEPDWVPVHIIDLALEIALCDPDERVMRREELLSETEPYTPKPKVNPHQEEMRRRVDRLRPQTERVEYDSMVANVEELLQAEKNREPMSNYKMQLAMGADTLIVIGCMGIFGGFLARARSLDTSTQIVWAMVGVVFMVFVEGLFYTLKIYQVDAAAKHKKARLRSTLEMESGNREHRRVGPNDTLKGCDKMAGREDQALIIAQATGRAPPRKGASDPASASNGKKKKKKQ